MPLALEMIILSPISQIQKGKYASHHMAESTVCLKTNKQASMPSEGGHWEREGLETEGTEAQE